jgi:hypothetical protein
MSDQPRAIRVTRTVAAGAPALSHFLANLDNHWSLCGDAVEITSLRGPADRPNEALLTLRGPLGIRRAARTRLLGASANKVWGRAQLDNGTQARVTWRFAPARGTTEVELELELREAHLFDRWLFELIRPWATAQLTRALGRLAEIAAIAAEQVEPRPLSSRRQSPTSKEPLQ